MPNCFENAFVWPNLNTLRLNCENLIYGIQLSASSDDKIKAKYSLHEYKAGIKRLHFAILSTVNGGKKKSHSPNGIPDK